MTTEEIKDLIKELSNNNIEEAELTLAGNTRYEIKYGDDTIIFDRYNNADTNQSECYIKVGGFERVFPEGSEEFVLISEFVDFL